MILLKLDCTVSFRLITPTWVICLEIVSFVYQRERERERERDQDPNSLTFAE